MKIEVFGYAYDSFKLVFISSRTLDLFIPASTGNDLILSNVDVQNMELDVSFGVTDHGICVAKSVNEVKVMETLELCVLDFLLQACLYVVNQPARQDPKVVPAQDHEAL